MDSPTNSSAGPAGISLRRTFPRAWAMIRPYWFSEDRFLGLIRVGVETRAPTGLAEVFYARKLRLEL